MLAHGAVVTLSSEQSGERTLPLSDLLVEGRRVGELILDVAIETAGSSAIARTGRTPADVPIVGVVGRRFGHGHGVGDGAGDGDAAVTVMAACGVSAVPVLIEPDDLEALQPIDDHRSTASYRRHLVEVQVARVLEELS